MHKQFFLPFLLCLPVIFSSCRKEESFIDQHLQTAEDPLAYLQIKTDTIFNSMQAINMLVLPKNYIDDFDIEFSYEQKELKTTSAFGTDNNALAAINGGFFNMDSGGGVTYFEINDAVINRKRDPDLKWGIADSLMNGAIIISRNQQIMIQEVESEQFYESSKQESAVLVTGPLLVLNSELVQLANTSFVNRRHPRTCLGISEKSLVFVTIDGRSKEAEGMSLTELQRFLLSIGCTDAINLDGGGSTCMWIKNKGIVNSPSDIEGERAVSNALLILNKQEKH